MRRVAQNANLDLLIETNSAFADLVNDLREYMRQKSIAPCGKARMPHRLTFFAKEVRHFESITKSRLCQASGLVELVINSCWLIGPR